MGAMDVKPRVYIWPTETNQFWVIIGNWAFPYRKQLCDTKAEARALMRQWKKELLWI